MTIPETIIYPEYPNNVEQDPASIKKFNKELIYTLTRSYEEMADGINGVLKNSIQGSEKPFIPTISGTTVAAGASVTYTNQYAWVLRQGIIVDVWFDIQWSASAGHTGNLFVDLPYLVSEQTPIPSTEKPFVGSIQCSNITFTGSYCVCNAIPGTRRCEIWTCSTAAATANVAFDTAGQLSGSIRYVGKEIERN